MLVKHLMIPFSKEFHFNFFMLPDCFAASCRFCALLLCAIHIQTLLELSPCQSRMQMQSV